MGCIERLQDGLFATPNALLLLQLDATAAAAAAAAAAITVAYDYCCHAATIITGDNAGCADVVTCEPRLLFAGTVLSVCYLFAVST